MSNGQTDPAKPFYIALMPNWANSTVAEDLRDSVVGTSVSLDVVRDMAKAASERWGGPCYLAKVVPVETLAIPPEEEPRP